MTNMITENFTYHALDVLRTMPLNELKSLWDLVPTERQNFYKARYERYLTDKGAMGSDSAELTAIEGLIKFYTERRIVPYGANWTAVPENVVQAATSNVAMPDDTMNLPKKVTKVSPVLLALIGVVVVMMGFMMVRTVGGGKSSGVSGTKTGTPHKTPAQTLTPTPLALEAQNSIIRSSDPEKAGFSTVYPVNLRVSETGQNQPRLFVVQRKAINTTEWQFEDNPDTASYLAGVVVRRIIGIPFSDENKALFDSMGENTTFTLQMNTGISVQYTFASKEVINRSDTSILRQVSPGLVLVLVGERDAETQEPTPTRIVVRANYVYTQELSKGMLSTGFDLPLMDTATPTLTATPNPRVDVQLIQAETSADTLSLRLRIYNERMTPAMVDSSSIWLTFGYTEQPLGPKVAAQITPFSILPGQAADVTIVMAWTGKEPYALLSVFNAFRYSLVLK